MSLRWTTGLALAAMSLAFVLIPATGDASVVRALDIEQQLGLSDLVVEGRIGVRETSRDALTGRPITATPIHVIETLYGPAVPGGVVRLRQIRGHQNGQLIKVVGDPQLEAGDHVIVMLRRVDDRYFLTALSQSVFWIKGELSPARVEQRLGGLVRMAETSNGLVPAATIDPANLPTADELRRRIRAAGVSR